MKRQQRQGLLRYFPWQTYPEIRENQRESLELIDKEEGSVTLELPVGTGKTAVGFTFLRELQSQGKAPLFYTAPTKTIVQQVKTMHPEVQIAYGRNEHPCLYYPEEDLRADEIPCSLLVDCSHRVDQETGKTKEPGATACPYLLQKFQAKQGGIVACTTSFYLFTQLFSREWEQPAGLVVDEAHRIAQVVRNALSYEITDVRLQRAIDMIRKIGAEKEAERLKEFLSSMWRIIRTKPARTPALLESHEIRELMDSLMKVNTEVLWNAISAAVQKGLIDTKAERQVLKQLEVLVRDLGRYLRSFEFSLETEKRRPLNYTYAFYEEELEEGKKVQHRLVIRSYYVAPLIKRLLGERTLSCSATIGDPEVFGWETGIRNAAYALPSDFPSENTRVFLPTDTPNLAVKVRTRQQPTRVLRKIAQTCAKFADEGIRSLVVVVSNKERHKFLMLCSEEGVTALSYGNGEAPKDVIARFKAGEGEVLVGTVANYGEGIDLPQQIAPVIFFLRPGYPRPADPATQFEERRFGGSQRWRVWNWRVMIESLQVRGRNVRSSEDIGVTFFISQQFRRFLWAALPKWLKDSYRGDKTFDECVEEALEVLAKSESS